MSPFETALGPRFHHLMPQIRQLHGARTRCWSGQVTVTAAQGRLGRWAARLAGFPTAMDRGEFSLRIDTDANGAEDWRRAFGSHITTSSLWWDASAGLLREKVGPITYVLVPSVVEDRLILAVKDTKLFGRWALPSFLAPGSQVKIWQDEAGRYRFDISAFSKLTGPLIRYHGWLRPDEAGAFGAAAR